MKKCVCKTMKPGGIIKVYESKLGTRCMECKRIMFDYPDAPWWRKLKRKLFYPN